MCVHPVILFPPFLVGEVFTGESTLKWTLKPSMSSCAPTWGLRLYAVPAPLSWHCSICFVFPSLPRRSPNMGGYVAFRWQVWTYVLKSHQKPRTRGRGDSSEGTWVHASQSSHPGRKRQLLVIPIMCERWFDKTSTYLVLVEPKSGGPSLVKVWENTP